MLNLATRNFLAGFSNNLRPVGDYSAPMLNKGEGGMFGPRRGMCDNAWLDTTLGFIRDCTPCRSTLL